MRPLTESAFRVLEQLQSVYRIVKDADGWYEVRLHDRSGRHALRRLTSSIDRAYARLNVASVAAELPPSIDPRSIPPREVHSDLFEFWVPLD